MDPSDEILKLEYTSALTTKISLYSSLKAEYSKTCSNLISFINQYHSKKIAKLSEKSSKLLKTIQSIQASSSLSQETRKAMKKKINTFYKISESPSLSTYPSLLSTYLDSLFSITKDKSFRILTNPSLSLLKKEQFLSEKIRVNLEGHSHPINSVVFTSSTEVVTGCTEGKLRVWDLNSFTLKHTFHAHRSSVTSVKTYKNLIISCSTDCFISIIDQNSITQTQYFKGHEKEILTMAVSPDIGLLATGSEDKTIKVWNILNNFNVYVLEDHKTCVTALLFHQNFLFSGSDDKLLRVWDLESRSLKYCLEGHQREITGLSVSKKTLYSSSEDCSVIFWDLEKFSIEKKQKLHQASIRCLFVNESYLITGSSDKTVKVSAITGENIINFNDHSGVINSIAVDSGTLVTVSNDCVMNIYSLKTMKKVFKFESSVFYSTCVKVSEDSKYIVSGYSDKILRVWEVSSKQLKYIFEGHTKEIRDVLVNADCTLVLSSSEDKSIKLWNVGEETCLFTFEGHKRPVNCITSFKNFKVFWSGSEDSRIIKWSIDGKLLNVYERHQKEVTCLALNISQRILISGSSDRTIKLWNTLDDTLINSVETTKSGIIQVLSSPNEDSFIVCSSDSVIKKITLPEVIEKTFALSPNINITDACIDTLGKLLFVSSFDKTIYIWDIYSLSLINSVVLRISHMNSIAFIQSLDALVIAPEDKALKIITLPPTQLKSSDVIPYSGWFVEVIPVKSRNLIGVFTKDQVLRIYDFMQNSQTAFVTSESLFYYLKNREIPELQKYLAYFIS